MGEDFTLPQFHLPSSWWLWKIASNFFTRQQKRQTFAGIPLQSSVEKGSVMWFSSCSKGFITGQGHLNSDTGKRIPVDKTVNNTFSFYTVLKMWRYHWKVPCGVFDLCVVALRSCFSMSASRFCLSCMQVTQYTVLPMVSHYSSDQQVAVTRQVMQQCGNKDSKEEDCRLVNMDVNSAGLKIL